MATNNAVILDKIWANGTNQYQQAVPQATIEGIDAVFRNIFAPQNGMIYNQFLDAFINLVGQQRVIQQAWTNPLAKFKGEKLTYGSSVQESAVAWIKAHTYNAADEDLLKLEQPEAAVWYHSLNREDKYPISVDRPALMQAFRDEYGLNKLINQIIQTPINSDNFDEYNCMINLVAEYEARWGFFKQNVSALPTEGESAAKETLQQIRKYVELLRFPSTQYNATAFDIPIPVFVNQDEPLVLLVTAEQSAAIDVQALATLFNLEKGDYPTQIEKVVVPELPVPDAFAILTTRDFFVCNDVVYETGSFYDPNTLCTKYILHHWEIVSASPFVPAIMLTTEAGTSIPVVTMTASGMDVTATPNAIHPGDTAQIVATLKGSVSPSDSAIELLPDAAHYTVSCDGVALNSRTYVDRLGVLHTQKSGWGFSEDVTSRTLVVTAEAAYINPSGATPSGLVKSVNITVTPA